jgi:hypothetical protein
MMSFLFGAFIGVCVYLMVDGYMAMREHKCYRDEEYERWFRRAQDTRAHIDRLDRIVKDYNDVRKGLN